MLEAGYGGTAHRQYSLVSAAAHVGCGNEVMHFEEFSVHWRFHRKNIKGGSSEGSIAETSGQGLFINKATSGSIDEKGALFHSFQIFITQQTAGGLIQWNMQCDHGGPCEKFVEFHSLNAKLAVEIRVVPDIPDQDPATKRLQECDQILSDVAAANDPDGLAAQLVAG